MNGRIAALDSFEFFGLFAVSALILRSSFFAVHHRVRRQIDATKTFNGKYKTHENHARYEIRLKNGETAR